LILLFSATACASPEVATPSTDAITQETSEEECYCSVRKRQQVEDRLKKKKELEPE
jgi:hypothetical protein